MTRRGTSDTWAASQNSQDPSDDFVFATIVPGMAWHNKGKYAKTLQPNNPGSRAKSMPSKHREGRMSHFKQPPVEAHMLHFDTTFYDLVYDTSLLS